VSARENFEGDLLDVPAISGAADNRERHHVLAATLPQRDVQLNCVADTAGNPRLGSDGKAVVLQEVREQVHAPLHITGWVAAEDRTAFGAEEPAHGQVIGLPD
jgi:hypothetical protein